MTLARVLLVLAAVCANSVADALHLVVGQQNAVKNGAVKNAAGILRRRAGFGEGKKSSSKGVVLTDGEEEEDEQDGGEDEILHDLQDAEQSDEDRLATIDSNLEKLTHERQKVYADLKKKRRQLRYMHKVSSGASSSSAEKSTTVSSTSRAAKKKKNFKPVGGDKISAKKRPTKSRPANAVSQRRGGSSIPAESVPVVAAASSTVDNIGSAEAVSAAETVSNDIGAAVPSASSSASEAVVVLAPPSVAAPTSGTSSSTSTSTSAADGATSSPTLPTSSVSSPSTTDAPVAVVGVATSGEQQKSGQTAAQEAAAEERKQLEAQRKQLEEQQKQLDAQKQEQEKERLEQEKRMREQQEEQQRMMQEQQQQQQRRRQQQQQSSDEDPDDAFKQYMKEEDGQDDLNDPAYQESANALSMSTGWQQNKIEANADAGIKGLTSAIGGKRVVGALKGMLGGLSAMGSQ